MLNASTTYSGTTSAAAVQTPMQSHAEHLHKLASRLGELTGLLDNALDRMTGPQAQQGVDPAKPQPEPSGILYVAQFGAERISIGLDRLEGSLSRLNNLV